MDVLLRLTLGPDGRVHGIWVLRSGGQAADSAAVAAVVHSSFIPAMLGGVPARVVFEMAFHFSPLPEQAAPQEATAPENAPGPEPP